MKRIIILLATTLTSFTASANYTKVENIGSDRTRMVGNVGEAYCPERAAQELSAKTAARTKDEAAKKILTQYGVKPVSNAPTGI